MDEPAAPAVRRFRLTLRVTRDEWSERSLARLLKRLDRPHGLRCEKVEDVTEGVQASAPGPGREPPMDEPVLRMIRAWTAGRREEVLDWLRRLGCRVEAHPGGTWTVVGLAGCRSVLTTEMPAGETAVQIGQALGGTLWTRLYPGLLEAVATGHAGGLKP